MLRESIKRGRRLELRDASERLLTGAENLGLSRGHVYDSASALSFPPLL
jgi:hypothetical protein